MSNQKLDNVNPVPTTLHGFNVKNVHIIVHSSETGTLTFHGEYALDWVKFSSWQEVARWMESSTGKAVCKAEGSLLVVAVSNCVIGESLNDLYCDMNPISNMVIVGNNNMI